MSSTEENNEKLEEAFSWIEQGNAYEKEKKFWDASAAFFKAMDVLKNLADETLPTDEEQTQIMDLYKQQSQQYFDKSREAFQEALQDEQKSDQKRYAEEQLGPKCSSEAMSDEEAENRIRLFMTIWAKDMALQNGGEEAEATGGEPELSENDFEDRFRRLSQSISELPSDFKTGKTETQRMSDINRGLGRLGLSLPDSSKPEIDLDPIPASEDDQIAEIMAQAKEEVAMDATRPMIAATAGTDEIDNMLDLDPDLNNDEEDEELDDMSDLEKADRIKNKRMVRRHVVKAQAKLAELVALLDADEEGDGAQQPTKSKDNDDSDSDEDDEIEDGLANVDVHFGQKLLKVSDAYLRRALKKWIEEA